MYGKFAARPAGLKKKKTDDVPRADSFVFRLHYRFTFVLLWVAAVMVSSTEYVDRNGSTIQCMQDKGTIIKGEILNNYCYIMSTYSIARHYNNCGTQNEDWLHPGVGALEEEDEQVYHAYYQWVPFMLVLQAICFYVPHWIWKQLEGGMMEKIVTGLNSAVTGERCSHRECTEETCNVKQLATYMKQRLAYSWDNKVWAAKFYFCEFLNFVNICLQLKITDVFLGNAFSDYGISAATWSDDPEECRTDPMIKVFPRMTKCHFNLYGGSGTIQKFDALCVLGMNIINEKTYAFLWFWFMFLAVVTGVMLVVRMVPLCIPSVRPWGTYNLHTIMNKFHFKLPDWGNWGQRQRTEEMLGKLTFADWMLVEHLGKWMHKDNFTDLINMMADNMKEEEQGRDTVQYSDSTLQSKQRLLEKSAPSK